MQTNYLFIVVRYSGWWKQTKTFRVYFCQDKIIVDIWPEARAIHSKSYYTLYIHARADRGKMVISKIAAEDPNCRKTLPWKSVSIKMAINSWSRHLIHSTRVSVFRTRFFFYKCFHPYNCRSSRPSRVSSP